MKKVLPFIFVLLSLPSFAQISIDALRREYHKVTIDSAVCAKLYSRVTKAGVEDNLFIGYKGAITAAMANHSRDKAEKLRLFKAGKELLEKSIASDANNIELRFLRFTIQTNSPKVLGYNKQIESDKKYIWKNFSSLSNIAVKNMIIDFVSKSTHLTEAEKQQLKQ